MHLELPVPIQKIMGEKSFLLEFKEGFAFKA